MNNLHITLGPFNFGSRIIKETTSLINSGLVKNIYIIARHENNLKVDEEIQPKIKIHRVVLSSRNMPRIFVMQIVKYIEYLIKVVIFSKNKNIKLINVHNLGALPIGFIIKIINSAKLVYDAHELETEVYGLNGIKKLFAKIIEKILIKSTDLNIVVGELIKEWYSKKYNLSNIVTVLNCPAYINFRKNNLFNVELNIPTDKIIIIYQGGLVVGRGVETLLDIFSKNDDGKHVLVMMGYGELESKVITYSNRHKNIYFKEAVLPDKVLDYTSSADIGIAFINNPSLNDYYCLPNKLFEYIMARIPVIVNDAPEMKHIIKKYNIGYVMDMLSHERIQNALKYISKIKSDELQKQFELAASEYNWSKQERIMINAYKKFIFKMPTL